MTNFQVRFNNDQHTIYMQVVTALRTLEKFKYATTEELFIYGLKALAVHNQDAFVRKELQHLSEHPNGGA